jgi:hypothetical protein
MDAAWLERLCYAFLTLIAGEAVLLVFLLVNAVRLRAAFVGRAHRQPSDEISAALERSIVHANASLIG